MFISYNAICLLLLSSQVYAYNSIIQSTVDTVRSMTPKWFTKRATSAAANSTRNVWLLEDTYAGKTFFDTWDFWQGPDPTRGLVHYLDRNDSFAANLAYVTQEGTVIMKGDDTTTLPLGVNRSSVRISSQKLYSSGLFLLDLNRAPWGCGVWPAFWTVNSNWPHGGEIDIFEGVHDNSHNQVTWHTDPGCNLVPSNNYTGSLVGQTDCNANINNNAGCGIIDWSRVSYGEDFDSQDGGVYAMEWTPNGISVWYFYRVSVPDDITQGIPNPDSWTTPSATLSPLGCDISKYFVNHSIVFDITFCGDWAGNTYSSNPACPGTCPERLLDPTNFVNASWSINSLKIYKQQQLFGVVSGASRMMYSSWLFALIATIASLTTIL